MNNLPVEFLDVVEVDLRHARNFYDSWKDEGSKDFHQKFLETVSWIEWNPRLFPRKYKNFHRAIIRRTYFALYYVVETHCVTVVAVLDMRRDPRVIRALLSLRAGV